MENYLFLFDEWWYTLILTVVMIISGVVKQYNLFVPFYNFLIQKVKNKKILVVLLSLFGGVLPVPGRVIISAGLLDTIAPKDLQKRSKFGIIDYLATHHYYTWSPLEKTILIPMAVLKLSYWDVLSYTWPLLATSILFLIGHIWTLNSDDVAVHSIQKMSHIKKPWFRFIDWKTIGIVFCVILMGNYIKQNYSIIKNYIEMILKNNIDFLWLSLIAFLSSFALGSSSKFASITSLLTVVLGLPYFTYLFAIDYIGYLLSPCHKCIAIGMLYFKTPLKQYYKVIGLWCVLLLLVGLLSLKFL